MENLKNKEQNELREDIIRMRKKNKIRRGIIYENDMWKKGAWKYG